MKIERIRRVEQIMKIKDMDLADKQFKGSLDDKRRQFKEKLQQDAKKKKEEAFDRKKAKVEADIARLAAEMRIKRIDNEEQEK